MLYLLFVVAPNLATVDAWGSESLKRFEQGERHFGLVA
jgi:hypothetical protein